MAGDPANTRCRPRLADKDLWTYENFLRELFDPCWVDPLDRFHGDVCGVPPELKMLDSLHANKNALNGWMKAVWTKYPDLSRERFASGWQNTIQVL